jgi:hypothetical protein
MDFVHRPVSLESTGFVSLLRLRACFIVSSGIQTHELILRGVKTLQILRLFSMITATDYGLDDPEFDSRQSKISLSVLQLPERFWGPTSLT